MLEEYSSYNCKIAKNIIDTFANIFSCTYLFYRDWLSQPGTGQSRGNCQRAEEVIDMENMSNWNF